MQDYAIVKIDHRQYIVQPGKTYTVDKFEAEPGKKLQLEVLARGKGEKFEIGTPILGKVKAEIEVLEQGKDKKVTSNIYKAKSRYRRRRGIRPRITTFKVLKIA